MNWRMRKMPNALARFGTITPARLPSIPSCPTIRNSGMSVTIGGRNIVAMRSAKSALRPRKRYLANTYPARRLVTRMPAVVIVAMSAEFKNDRPTSITSPTWP
jgi:hypothetical protein